MSIAGSEFHPRLAHRHRVGRVFTIVCLLLCLTGAVLLGILLVTVVRDGWDWLTPHFVTNFPSFIDPTQAGMKSAIVGSLWLMGITMIVTLPVGIASAVYLEEYAPNNGLTRLIQINIANLAGVPSIVYGILGLAVFTRWFSLGFSVLAGGLTLSLLTLPVVIIASREALAAVPKSIRLAAYALGATKWQTVQSHVLPAAVPGIATGVILSLSRAIGEAAPLLIIGGLGYVAFVPSSPFDEFTAMPIQIYNWCDLPQQEFQHLAAAGIIVLLAILLPMNAFAVGVRAWRQRKKNW